MLHVGRHIEHYSIRLTPEKVMLYQTHPCIERAPFTPQPAGSDRTMKRTSSSDLIIEQLALPYNTSRMFLVQPPGESC
jgi:hypothetical protein